MYNRRELFGALARPAAAVLAVASLDLTREFEGMRVTPSVYTTLQEIDSFCEAMEQVIEKGLPA